MIAPGPAYPIAIDAGERELHIVQLRAGRSGFDIRAAACADLPSHTGRGPDGVRGLGDFLRHLRRAGGFRGRSASLHLPPGSLHSFPVTFEVGRNQTEEEALVQAAEGRFPCPLRELSVDYACLDRVPGKGPRMRRASVVGVRRDEVQHWLAAAKLAGLSIEVVECWLCSLIRLHRFLRGGTPHPVVLCHIGRGHSLFAVVAGESVLAHRTVAWGTDLIEQRLKVNLELLTDEDHAAALVRDIGLGFGDPQAHDPPASTPTDPVDRTVYQLAAPLVDELIHNFHSLTGFVMAEIHRVQFEGLFLYGRAASVRGLAAYVQQRTGLATEVVGPASQPASTGPGENPTPAGWGPFDLAVGLGMRRVSWL